MSVKKSSKLRKLRAIVAGFLVFIAIFTGVNALTPNTYAVPGDNSPATVVEDTSDSEDNSEIEETTENSDSESESGTTEETTTTATASARNGKTVTTGNGCKDSMGALGWVVCPMMDKVSDFTDWIYNTIKSWLVISPIELKDGSPVYEIWKYCLGVTNVVFVIFLLIVIYSQITG